MVKSVRFEHDILELVRISKIDITDLVEFGLLSLAKNPGSRNDRLLQAAYNHCVEKAGYYSALSEDLKSRMDVLNAEAAPVATPKRETPDIAVRGHTGTGYWITRTMIDQLPGVFTRVVDESIDGMGDWPMLYSVDDIPNEELKVEV